MVIDIDALRRDLIDYYGSAMFSGMHAAMMDLTKVENASPEEVVEIALENHFDLSKYQVYDREEER